MSGPQDVKVRPSMGDETGPQWKAAGNNVDNLEKGVDDGGFGETKKPDNSNTSEPAQNVAPTTTMQQLPPPDGGYDAWMTVAGAWCGFFVSFGWMNSIGVFQEYYQQQPLAHDTPSEVSWISSTEIFFLFFGGPVCGKFFDSYGPRGLLIVGTFLHVFGLMMLSLSTEYYQIFLAQSVCSACGASAIFYASMNAVLTWFLKKRATAAGIIASGSSIGGVVLPIMVDRLIPEVGFGWTMRTVAFIILGLMIIANSTIKSRLTHTKKPFNIMDFVLPLGEVPFLLFALGSFFFFFGTFLPYNFLILQAQTQGMSHDLSNYLIPILNAASIFGRILPGILADRFGRYNMMILITALCALVVLAVWLPGYGNVPIIIFAAFYGFFSGASVSLAPAVVAQISEIRQIGVRNGTLYALVSIGALIGNPIGGALVTRDRGSFRYLQIFCGVTMVVGCALVFASRIAKTGLKWNIF